MSTSAVDLLRERSKALRSYGTPDTASAKQHTSLLATPASRHTGGRLTPQPSPSILGGYERRLEAEAGYSYNGSPLAAPPSRLATGGIPSHSASVTTRLTPSQPSPYSSLMGKGTGVSGSSSLQTMAAPQGSHRLSSPAKKPNWLEQQVLGQQHAASGKAHSLASLLAAAGNNRPSPAAAKLAAAGAGLTGNGSPRRPTLQEQLHQLQLSCSRTAARNSTAVDILSSSASPAAMLPTRPASHQQTQLDFQIRAHPGTAAASIAGLATPSAGSASSGGASPARAPQSAHGALAQNNSVSTGLGLRLAPLFDSQQGSQHPLQQAQQAEQTAGWRPRSAASSPVKALSAVEQAGNDSSARGSMVLLSRINELEAQLQLERLKSQEAAAATEGLQERCDQLQQQARQQAGALEAARMQAAEAEARATEAAQEVAALRGDVQRRQSVHSDSVDSIARMQVVGQVQRQENEELRQRVAQLNEAWEQENAHVARLHDQLKAAGASQSQVAERLRRAEEEWEQRLQEVRQAATEEQRELASRCQMLEIEKVAQEQAARQAAARQQAAEERAVAAEQRWRQLSADLDAAAAGSDGQNQQLQAARQQAEAAEEAARQLRRQLLEQRQYCEDLEADVAGERERSSSIAARAETAEAAQHGLGSHVKATHTQMQRMQEQLASAQRQCRQLQDESEEMRQSHAASQASYEHQLITMQGQLSEAEEERDQLRQRLAKATADLEAQLQASDQHRQQVAALQQAVREARAGREAQEAAAAQQAQQALSAQSQCEALESRLALLEGQLQEARQAAAAAEDQLTKAGRNSSGASPLRDVVSVLRNELQEKDLQLMQVHEDLSRERSKAQELQKQVLDQAVELDELQRDSSDAFGLRQQLAAAQQAAQQAQREAQQLKRQATSSPSPHAASGQHEGSGIASPRGSGSSSGMTGGASPARHERELQAARQEIERLKGERDSVRDELDRRDAEVMQLQGQLVVMQQHVRDEGNWLSSLPDPDG